MTGRDIRGETEHDTQQICRGGCLSRFGRGRERVIAYPVGVPPTAKPFDVIEGNKISIIG